MWGPDDSWCADGDALLEVVAAALKTPCFLLADVRAAGRAAYTWRTVDSELAQCLAGAGP